MLKNILLFPMLALLVGCASTVNLSPEAKSKIKTIKISENVTAPDGMFYYGRSAALLGNIGMLTEISAREQLDKEAPPAELKAINVTAFKNALSKTHYRVVNGDADATMTIIIRSYGFIAPPFGLTKTIKPELNVVAMLANKKDQIIWIQWSYISDLSKNTPSTSEDELLAHPEKLRAIYQLTANIAANQIVKTLT
jgi:hypothetical protein